jgi:hypothetical protein
MFRSVLLSVASIIASWTLASAALCATCGEMTSRGAERESPPNQEREQDSDGPGVSSDQTAFAPNAMPRRLHEWNSSGKPRAPKATRVHANLDRTLPLIRNAARSKQTATPATPIWLRHFAIPASRSDSGDDDSASAARV